MNCSHPGLAAVHVTSRHLPEQFERWWVVAAERDFGTGIDDLDRKAITAISWDAALETSGVVDLPLDMHQAVDRFGATGEFPKGRVSEDDEGELRFGIRASSGKVIVDFGKQVASLGAEEVEK